jgi:hypothetical protein
MKSSALFRHIVLAVSSLPRPYALSALAAATILLGVVAGSMHQPIVRAADTPQSTPAYTADGQLLFPEKYREWIYLTTGIDMSYTPGAGGAGHSMFDNVFVNPESYRSFVATGTWPDKTILLIEVRGAESRGSINKSGHFQTTAVMAIEAHVKDSSRADSAGNGGWAFYSFNNLKSAEKIPTTASCYSCHQQHAAVDTTFVQFYPTLLTIARQKNTFSPAYLKDEAAAQP